MYRHLPQGMPCAVPVSLRAFHLRESVHYTTMTSELADEATIASAM